MKLNVKDGLSENEEWLFQALTEVLESASERGMERYDLCQIFLLVAFDINQKLAPTSTTGVIVALQMLVDRLVDDQSDDESKNHGLGSEEERQGLGYVH